MSGEAPAPRREDLPDGSVRIWFSSPIFLHAEPKGFLTLRPPQVGERWEHGEPNAYVFNAEGLGTPYTDRPCLRGWIERLIVDHDIDIIGRSSDLALGLLIEEAVLGFFTNARKRLRTESARSPQPE